MSDVTLDLPAPRLGLRTLGRELGAAATGVAVSLPLGLVYLALNLPSADLAAATYRSDLFARVGFTLWDNGWYAGHALPGYSVLSPALGALLTPRGALVVSAVLASALFGAIAQRTLHERRAAIAATAWFAVTFCVGLISGRVPYDLAVALALACVAVALTWRGSAALVVAAVLACASSLTSPVAGSFLALAMLSAALAGRDRTRNLALAAVALLPALALTLAFGEGGYEPFVPSAFWPVLAGTLGVGALFALLGRRVLAIAAGLYAIGQALSFAIATPMGGNATRMGSLFAGALVVGLLWRRHPRLLALLVLPLAYWSVVTPLRDLQDVGHDPSVNASYFAPLLAELQRLGAGQGTRVEVPLTRSHWEAVHLAEHVSIARGWERQLDTRFDGLFYRRTLRPGAYDAWLHDNAIAYVALPDAPLDGAATNEGALVASGPRFLAPIWRSRHWRLFAVGDGTPIVPAPARLTSLTGDGVALSTPRPAAIVVRVHWSHWWSVASGNACITRADGDWTLVRARSAGTIRLAQSLLPRRCLARP